MGSNLQKVTGHQEIDILTQILSHSISLSMETSVEESKSVANFLRPKVDLVKIAPDTLQERKGLQPTIHEAEGQAHYMNQSDI